MNECSYSRPAELISILCGRNKDVHMPISVINTKIPLAGVLAKQNRMGYALIDVVAKVYSHSFAGIIAEEVRVCQITLNVRIS